MSTPEQRPRPEQPARTAVQENSASQPAAARTPESRPEVSAKSLATNPTELFTPTPESTGDGDNAGSEGSSQTDGAVDGSAGSSDTIASSEGTVDSGGDTASGDTGPVDSGGGDTGSESPLGGDTSGAADSSGSDSPTDSGSSDVAPASDTSGDNSPTDSGSTDAGSSDAAGDVGSSDNAPTDSGSTDVAGDTGTEGAPTDSSASDSAGEGSRSSGDGLGTGDQGSSDTSGSDGRLDGDSSAGSSDSGTEGSDSGDSDGDTDNLSDAPVDTTENVNVDGSETTEITVENTMNGPVIVTEDRGEDKEEKDHDVEILVSPGVADVESPVADTTDKNVDVIPNESTIETDTVQDDTEITLTTTQDGPTEVDTIVTLDESETTEVNGLNDQDEDTSDSTKSDIISTDVVEEQDSTEDRAIDTSTIEPTVEVTEDLHNKDILLIDGQPVTLINVDGMTINVDTTTATGTSEITETDDTTTVDVDTAKGETTDPEQATYTDITDVKTGETHIAPESEEEQIEKFDQLVTDVAGKVAEVTDDGRDIEEIKSDVAEDLIQAQSHWNSEVEALAAIYREQGMTPKEAMQSAKDTVRSMAKEITGSETESIDHVAAAMYEAEMSDPQGVKSRADEYNENDPKVDLGDYNGRALGLGKDLRELEEGQEIPEVAKRALDRHAAAVEKQEREGTVVREAELVDDTTTIYEPTEPAVGATTHQGIDQSEGAHVPAQGKGHTKTKTR